MDGEFDAMMMRLAVPDDAVKAAVDEMHKVISADPGANIVVDEFARRFLVAALPYLQFCPTGDNHHNAKACPYCNPEVAGASE